MFSQKNEPCDFDNFSNHRKYQWEAEKKIQATIQKNLISGRNKDSKDSIRTIPVVVHIIHNGGPENISESQVKSQIQILNEDYGKLTGTNGYGNGVDTDVRFCLAKKDPNGRCTNGIVRIKSKLTNHQTYQRSLLKELSFWDNTRYLNIYVVKSINGNVGGYSSFPGGPPDEDGVVVRHNLFGNTGTASSSLGRTTTHELGHWLGLYHTFNNGCGLNVCTDGDYVCDTPPQASPNYSCTTLNTCSNDFPDENDQKENYMNYTPGSCQNMFTAGQKQRIKSSLDTIRNLIWSQINLVATGCDSNYIAPARCPVVADFVTLTTDICTGNSVKFFDRSLNNPSAWKWVFSGGNPSTSIDQNPTITYNSPGTYKVKLFVSDSMSADSLERTSYISVSDPEKGDALSFKENFDAGKFPPTTLTIVNYDNGVTWELDSMAFVSGKYSIKINNLINTNYGSTDELVFPEFDLTTANPDSNVYLSFMWAYAKSDPSYSDELLVLISTDCGVNYNQIFYRSQNALATAPVQTSPFVPSANQWKSAYIPINGYRNESNVQLKIVNVTDGGNNLYIDDIYVGDGSIAFNGIADSEEEYNDVKIFPNPAKDYITIEFISYQVEEVSISIYSIHGEKIQNKSFSSSKGLNTNTISLLSLSKGIYFVSIESSDFFTTQKLVIAP